MNRPWPRAAWTIVLRCIAVLGLCVIAAGSARGDDTAPNEAVAPIVRIALRNGDVTIRTWDRSDVQVSADPAITVERRTVRPAGGGAAMLIPQTGAATASGQLALPPESFVPTTFAPGPRTLVLVRGTPGAGPPAGPVSVNVPADSVFIYARTGNGNIDVHGYRGGTFVGFVGRGRLALDGVGGTVFAQTKRGPLTVTDSTLERIRARSLLGNMTFERCNVRQIEATSVAGSIVYDGGHFAPGLARFESSTGDVAIGTAAAAQVGGRATGGGRVYTNFNARTRVDTRDGEAVASVAGGGPVVTATSASGNVFLYDGSLRTRAGLPPQWNAPAAVLQRPQAHVHRDLPGARAPEPGTRPLVPHQPRREGAHRAATAKTFAAPPHRASRYAAARSLRVYNRTLRRNAGPAIRPALRA